MTLILAKYVFSGPFNLKDAKLPDKEDMGLYGIFYLRNPEKKVADYGVLYIGDITEIEEEKNFPYSHKKYNCWIEKGKGEDNLYIGYCLTPGILPKQREAIKRYLVHKYNTICNK